MIENENSCSSETRNKIALLYQKCLKCHQHLFLPIFFKKTLDNKNQCTVLNKVDEILEEYNLKNENRKILFDESYSTPNLQNTDIEAIYYIWNNILSREIYYILDNVAKNVEDSEMTIIEGENVAGQVKIEIKEMELIINIYNNSETEIDTIRSKSKQRYQKEVLNLLGIEIGYKENSCNGITKNPFFKKNAIMAEIMVPNIYKYERRK